MRNPTIGMLRSIFAFTTLLAAAGVHAQQNINVTAANSINNNIYAVTFVGTGGTTSTPPLNTDQKSLYSLQSLAFVKNPITFAVDLFAADNQNGKVLDYTGDFSKGAFQCPPGNTAPPCTTGTVVTQAAGIIYPNGLSTDNAGNLFVLNDAPGHSPQAQVWVLQPNPNGGFLTATPIDKTSFSKNEGVVDTLIVGPPLGSLANTGDLLVVTSNPATVIQYAGNGSTGPIGLTSPNTLIPQCAAPTSKNCIPAGTAPGGIAVWPQDSSPFSNSVLISTQSGSILSFTLSGSTVTRNADFIDGLPAGLFRIKTGRQSGTPLAFVAQSGPGNHGSVMKLGLSGSTGQVLATVTSGVAAPIGLAVTNLVQAPSSGCALAQGGCALFGDKTIKHTVIPDGPGNLNSNITENLCVVPQDPRLLPGGTGCPGSTLIVNSVCPGFDNTNGVNPMVIPKNFCGASGSSGTGFALIQTLTAPGQFNATYIASELDPNTVFPGANNPVCGSAMTDTGAVLWAPLSGESLLVEDGVSITNPGSSNPFPTLVDTTDGCGSGKSGQPQVSLFGSGLALMLPGGNTNTPAMQAFVQAKYTNLAATISQLAANGNISTAVVNQLTNPGGTGCFDLSLNAFNLAVAGISPTANFQDAADLLTNADPTSGTTCDSIVTNNANIPGAFMETLPPLGPGVAPVYNPSGQLRWRFANIANAITMRILNEPPTGGWSPPVSVSVSPQGAFAQCITAGCPMPQQCFVQGCPQSPQMPMTATLSWSLASGVSGCTWSSDNDSAFNANPPNPSSNTTATVPFTTTSMPGTTYTYTLSCNSIPPGSAPASPFAASTTLTVWPQVTVTATNTGTQSWNVNWTPPAGGTGCSLTAYRLVGNPPSIPLQQQNVFGTLGGTLSGNGPANASLPLTTYPATYTGNSNDGTVYFTASCTSGASPGTTSVFVPE